MLPQEKPLDYQTEEEYLMLQGAWRHTYLSLTSFAQLQSQVSSVCEGAGVSAVAQSPLFSWQ